MIMMNTFAAMQGPQAFRVLTSLKFMINHVILLPQCQDNTKMPNYCPVRGLMKGNDEMMG